MTTQEYFDIEKLKLPERAQQALMVMNVSCAELLQKESFISYAKYGSKSLDAIRNLLNQIRSLLLENSFDDSLEYIGRDTIYGKRKLYFELHKSDLSARAQSVLDDLSLSFSQIMDLTRRDVFAFKNCGTKTAKEILSYIDSIKEHFPYVANIDDSEEDDKKFYNFTYEEISQNISVRAFLIIKNYRISNRKELAKFLYECQKIRNLGKKTRAELFAFYENLVYDEFIRKPNESYRIELVDKYNSFSSIVLPKALEYIYTKLLYLIETNKREQIRTYYQSHTDVLLLDIDKELKKAKVPIESQLGKSLYAFRDLYFENAETIINKPFDEWAIYDDLEYLSEKERLFVLNYKESHKHFPLYFLMQEAIRHVHINSDYSYEILSGIFNITDSTKKKVDRIPNTYERKQKLLYLSDALRTKYAPLLINDAYSSIRNSAFLSEENTNFALIQKEEQLDINFAAFCFLSGVLFPEIIVLNLQWYNNIYCDVPICGYQVPSPVYSFALHQKLCNFKYAKALTDIWTKCSQKCILENVEINLYPKYLLNVEMWEEGSIDYSVISNVLDVLQLILSNILVNINVENGILYIRANSIDKKRFLYEYIATHERPVSISEVMQVFNARHPEWAFESANQVRYYLSDKALFKSIGKTSLYVIKESAMFTGNIMDAIRQVMQSLDNPTNIEIIISRVLKLRPDSTHKSVRTNIKQMAKNGEIIISENNLRLLK